MPERLTSVMEFAVAMSYSCGASLYWLNNLSCGQPLEGRSSDLTRDSDDKSRPFLLLMLVSIVELRLRLPTKDDEFKVLLGLHFMKLQYCIDSDNHFLSIMIIFSRTSPPTAS